MSPFSYIERERINGLFGIKSGYVFDYFNKDGYNKNNTKEIILDSCGINIYEDDDYKTLSQQKCVEKIFKSGNNVLIANLLHGLSEYFCFKMNECGYNWGDDDQNNYSAVQDIIERLKTTDNVSLPDVSGVENIEMLKKDIETNMQDNKPEMAVDRLHTYTAFFLQSLCQKHGIDIKKESGEAIPIDGLMAKLKAFYIDGEYVETEFAKTAIKVSIDLFAKFNNLRNNKSYAHPNELIIKSEARYAIDIVIPTLMLIEEIEKKKETASLEGELPF